VDRPGGIAVALTTVDSAAGAADLARVLVDERLVACVNIVAGVRSIYRWQGAVEDATEWLLVMKTTGQRLAGLQQRLLALHPYDTPEWVVLDVADVSAAYAKWVLGEVGVPAQ
jgi:periplasmic divalent cation tolerance protein